MSKSVKVSLSLASLLIVAVLAVAVLLLMRQILNSGQEPTTVSSFQECADAGYPVMQSDPRKCSQPGGDSFVESADEPQRFEFTSPKGVKISLNNFVEGQIISSPLVITGEVPGSWSFEASFPVVLTDWDGLIISQEPAQLQGDWMTEEMVPFEVTLTFEKPTYKTNGSIIFQKDNPSGLPEHDDALEFTIEYQ